MEEKMKHCCVCGCWFDIENEGVETNEGDDYCGMCAEKNAFQCDDCGTWHSKEYYENVFNAEAGVDKYGDTVHYCDICGEFYMKCPRCGRIYNHNEIHIMKRSALCRDCYDKEDYEELKQP